MTGKIPRSISDIEAFMAKASKELQWSARKVNGGPLVETAIAANNAR